jgi:hypothetical protein
VGGDIGWYRTTNAGFLLKVVSSNITLLALFGAKYSLIYFPLLSRSRGPFAVQGLSVLRTGETSKRSRAPTRFYRESLRDTSVQPAPLINSVP